MANLKSIVDGLDSVFAPVTADALNTSPLQFAGPDTVTVPAGGFTALYAFGDSLSDAGNISFATSGLLPVGHGIYSDGRFTNGNVWVQDLAVNLKLPAVKPSLEGGTDYAYGGAETGSTPVHALNASDLPIQLVEFDTNVPKPSPNALYTVWAGSNDVIDIANSAETPAQQQASVAKAVSNETAFIGAWWLTAPGISS